MPSVGTLNLTVESNAKAVGDSLGELAGALGRVKKAIPEGGLGLGGIGEEIKGFINSINEIKSASTVFKSIEQLGNGLKGIAQTVKYSTDSIKEVSESTNKVVSSINVQPLTEAIKKIKSAVGKGFNIGMAGTQLLKIKEAIGGDWDADKAEAVSSILSNIASSAREFGSSKISSIAGEITELTKSIDQYADAAKKYKEITNDRVDAATLSKEEWREKHPGLLPLNIQFHGGKAGSKNNNMADASGMGDWRYTLSNQTQYYEELQEKAEKIKEVVAQMQVTKAVMQNVADSVASVGDKFSSAISEESVVSPIRMISESFREAEKYIRYYESGIDAVLPKINQLSSEHMIEAGNAKLAAMSEKELRIALLDAQGDLPAVRVTSPVQTEQIRDLQQFNIELQETGSIIESVIIPRFQEMYQIWSMMAYEFGAFQMQAARLTGGNNPLLLGDGKTPGQLLLGDGSEPETFLSTWVRAGEEFKTNWVYFTSDVADQWRAMWSPDWVLGGWQTPVSMSTFHLGAGDSPLLLGDGGVSPDNMLSTWVDTSEQWQTNWIVGEGYVSDAVEETEQVAAATRDATSAAEKYEEKFYAILKEQEEAAALAAQIRAGQEARIYAEKPTIGLDQTNQMADNLTQLDLLKAQLQEAEGKYNQFVNELGAGSSKTIKAGLEVQRLRDSIWEYNNALREAIDEQDKATESAFSLSGAWSGFKGAIERMFPTLTHLLKRFKSMATMRALRYVIRQLAAGFSEGVQNVYHYSKAVGTSLAPAMDQAATALQQMKNSIGAAVAPVIQALVPVLQSVVNWLITGINYLNQFFALLNGQSTWTRALPQQAEAYKDTAKEAKKAGSAMKDLLADWDELNIIQSQGGSGAGSAAADTAKDYATMFEEVNSFEDGVKNVLSFIEEHLGGLPGILKKAGAMLLGWKFSKAFQGFLGDIGKLIAGGALVVLGVELSYGSGFSAGSKGFFDSGDIIGTIGGALATAIGGSLITTGLGIGGGIGFAIGIGVAVIATLTGWIEGQADFMDKMKWGDKEMTPDQIKDFIKSRFTFPVDPEITLLESNIQNKEDAEADLIRTVNDFTGSLTFAKIQVGIKAANSVDALTAAYISANDVIRSVQNYIDKTEKALAVTLSVSPIKDKNGNDITEELLKEVGIANTTLKDYFTELGKQLADAMYEGEKDGWTEGEMETVLALMEHQRNIVAKAEEMQRDITFEMNYRFNLNNLTRENAQDIMKEETELINAYKEKFMKDRETAKEAAIKELAWTEAAIEDYKKQGRDTTELDKAASTYRKLIQEYGDPENAEEAWKLKMEETLANMREDWIVALKDNYGILDKEFTEQRNPLVFTSVNSELTNAVYDAAKSRDPVGEASKALKTYFDEIKKQQPDYIQEMMDSLNLNVWDYANDEIKKNLASMLRNALGDDYAAMVLQSMRIPIDEIEKIFGDNYVFDPNNISFNQLKNKETVRPWYEFWKFIPPEDEFDEIVQPEIVAEPEIQLQLNERQVMTDLKNKIESALSDGQLDFTERTALELTFGKDAVTQILDELEYTLDEEGYSTGRGLPKNGYYVASAGAVSDVGWGSQNFVNANNEPMTDEDFASGVESGTRAANRDQNDILNAIMRGVDALLRKNWTVNITPSSSLGAVNSHSTRLYGMVTGETE